MPSRQQPVAASSSRSGLLPHPGLDRAEGMLTCLAPLTHLLRMLIEATLHRHENVLMLPSGGREADPAIRLMVG
jgi:hypothetical protein